MHRTYWLARVAIAATVLVGSANATGQGGLTLLVPAGGDLQDALDRAQPGDTVLLQAGATFLGNFVLPVKHGDRYITVRSSTSDERLPSPGQRMLPTYAPLLATVQSPNSLPALQTAAGAHHWRLLFLRIGPNAIPVSDVIRFGSATQTTREELPYALIIDRCYIHGDPHVGQKRGIALNSGATRIVNSYFEDFKLVGQDTQAIAGWNGPGPYQIENNYLEAAGENVLFGGADPSMPGLVPADITVRGNHVTKPLEWRRQSWQVKNLFELKNATRVLIERNLFEHNWQAAQAGPAILFTVRNQDGAAPWSEVSHVVFRANVVRHVAAVFNILGFDYNHPSGQTAHLAIHHNLFQGIDPGQWGGNGVFLLITDSARGVDVDHNTVMQSGAIVSVSGRPTEGFVFRNNLVRHNELGIKGQARPAGFETMRAFLPGAIVSHNVFGEGGIPSNYPPTNVFPSPALWMAQFRDYRGGDFALAPNSLYRQAASDGSAVGADMELLVMAFAAPRGGHD